MPPEPPHPASPIFITLHTSHNHKRTEDSPPCYRSVPLARILLVALFRAQLRKCPVTIRSTRFGVTPSVAHNEQIAAPSARASASHFRLIRLIRVLDCFTHCYTHITMHTTHFSRYNPQKSRVFVLFLVLFLVESLLSIKFV